MTERDGILFEAADISDQLVALRDELCLAPDPLVRERHLAAMEGAATSAQESHASIVPLAAGRRRRRALASIAAATVGVVALTGGLAAAGRLPATAQRHAAKIAGAVGWEIPGGTDRSTPAPRNGPTGDTPTTAARGERSGVPRGDRRSEPAPATPSATAPATPAAPPAAGSDAPGASGDAPGHTGANAGADDPGRSGTAPGHIGTNSGSGSPGSSGSVPGRADAPAAGDETPGKAGSSPGQTGK